MSKQQHSKEGTQTKQGSTQQGQNLEGQKKVVQGQPGSTDTHAQSKQQKDQKNLLGSDKHDIGYQKDVVGVEKHDVGSKKDSKNVKHQDKGAK